MKHLKKSIYKNNYNRPRKNFFINIIITLLFFFMIVSIIRPFMNVITSDVKLIMEIKSEGFDIYQVFYDTGKNEIPFDEEHSLIFEVNKSNAFQIKKLDIPIKNIKNLRIDLGTKPACIAIKEVKIKSFLKEYKWTAHEIIKDFKCSNDIKDIYVKDNVLYVKSNGIDPFIYNLNLNINLNNMTYSLYCSLLIAFLISFMFYYILYFTNFNLDSIFNKNIKILCDIVLIALFITVVGTPIVSQMFGFDYNINNTEKRKMMQRPKLSFDYKTLSVFAKDYEKYFNDNFAFRNLMINLNSRIKLKYLKVSSNKDVVLGKYGWLFYASKEDGQPIEDYRGTNLYNEEQLSKIKQNLEEQRDWLARRGISFVIAVAPNKSSIYPEYMPDNIIKISNKSKMDQVVEYLNNNSDIEIVDIKNALLEDKKVGRLYLETDTHWNELGAFIGYQEIMKKLNQINSNLVPKSISDFEIEKRISNGGDLASMLAMKEQIKQQYILLQPKFQKQAKEKKVNFDRGVAYETEKFELPKMVMFRDSFTISMIPFLSEHFRESIYIWKHEFDTKIINEERPDIVVHEIVERGLDHLLKDNSQDIKRDSL